MTGIGSWKLAGATAAVLSALVWAAAGAAAKKPTPSHASSATPIRVGTALVALQEAPKPALEVSRAWGHFAATLQPTKAGYEMTWRVIFSKLSGPATSAYVHRGTRGKYGPALFYLCGPCNSGSHGKAYASPSEVDLMLTGQAYVNIRTRRNPSGEIRGQIAKS